MTAEAYVKQIVKKVKCDKKRKLDIKKQLLYEIEERAEAGEDLQDILSEMGTVEEIAAGFNESISEADRKRYRRNTLVKILVPIVVVLLALIAVVAWYLPKVSDIESSDIFIKADVEQKLVEVITLLDEDDYESLQAISTDRMANVLTEDYMSAAKQQLSEEFGERASVGTVYMQEVRQMGQYLAVCQATVTYENVSIVYTITFDEDMKLAGLYMR